MEDLRRRERVPSPLVRIDSNNLRLQMSILTSIDSQITNESISETILDSLEKLEQLFRAQNIQTPQSMLDAYCAVALHCTFRCLPENSPASILDQRISKLEIGNSELVTDELRGWNEGIRVLQLNSDALNKWKETEKKKNTNYKEYALTITKFFVSGIIKAIQLAFKEAEAKESEEAPIDKKEIQGEMLQLEHAAQEIVSSGMGTSVNEAVSNSSPSSKSFAVKQVAISNRLADESLQISLESPKRKAVSPLKIYEDTKLTKRRPKNLWRPEEEDALREGVKMYGAGNWKKILNSNRNIFSNRLDVDLKDKWRNLMRPAPRS